MEPIPAPQNEVWTVGHSNKSLPDFLALLEGHWIDTVVDVRRFPASRRHPHFGMDSLGAALAERRVHYHHLPELGGRRSPRPDSVNINWRNAGFRGYADYMETPAFRDAVNRLTEMTRGHRVTLLCAEALWWQCHRSLIADALKVRGIAVHHILSATQVQEHPYTSAARIIEGRLTYAGETLFD